MKHNHIWITETHMVHYRQPEAMSTEYILAEDAEKRINELLNANNKLIEERRVLEHQLKEASLLGAHILKALVNPLS